MMFKWWVNMTVSPDGRDIVNRDVVCLHCRNVGMVVLDGENRGVPCPMCALGGYRNARWLLPMRVEQLGSVGDPSRWYWKSPADVDGVSWERGLTCKHGYTCTMCGVGACERGKTCESCEPSGVVV